MAARRATGRAVVRAPRRRRGTALSKPVSRARRDAFGLRVVFDVSDMVLLMNHLKRDAGYNIKPILLKAHAEMGHFLMGLVMDELDKKITDRGREQRGDALFEALGRQSNIQADESGFTYGFLEDAEGDVPLYARNLEKGTDVHLGTELVGFVRDGERVGPTRDETMQTDPRMIQLARHARTRPWGPDKHKQGRDEDEDGAEEAVRDHAYVHRPIPAYNYFQGGMQRWRRGFLPGKDWEESVLAIYNGHMQYAGASVIGLFFQQYGTSPPGAGQFAVRRILGNKVAQGSSQFIRY